MKGVVYRMQADAALIEARAKMRLADEYDAAQDRGDIRKANNEKTNSTGEAVSVQKHGGDNQLVDGHNKLSPQDIGLRRDEIHAAVHRVKIQNSNILNALVEHVEGAAHQGAGYSSGR